MYYILVSLTHAISLGKFCEKSYRTNRKSYGTISIYKFNEKK